MFGLLKERSKVHLSSSVALNHSRESANDMAYREYKEMCQQIIDVSRFAEYALHQRGR